MPYIKIGGRAQKHEKSNQYGKIIDLKEIDTNDFVVYK